MSNESSKAASSVGAGGGFGYAGDLDAKAAWARLEGAESAVLVDVRTRAEWEWVGVPDLSQLGRKAVFVEWQSAGIGQNPDFIAQVSAACPDKTAPLIFICRSGGRSQAAAIAMTQAGYRECYNLAGGFEGPHDEARHRGTRDGWKVHGLPWIQG